VGGNPTALLFNMKPTHRKRLFFDIEVSPNIGMFWKSGHEISVDHHSIIKERAIICICYKWEGEKKVYSLRWDKKQNDKKMVSDFIKVANSATELVGQNSDRFDITWVRTRALIHGIVWSPYINSLDTLKMARSGFNFNSNRLDYLGKILLNKGKIETGFGLWKDISLNNSESAMLKMIKYCKNDVILLEEVFDKLRPYIKPKMSYATNRGNCPECDSDRLLINKTTTLPSGNSKVQYLCATCSTYHTRTIINKK
jgi:DNA polymerase elongation subunit (family B)